ncbi:MAG: hypothetical protein JOZ42_08300 [Acetobacteraceae bacterium]|nr:hypothetical protein [Acetobacteraceae bacterium]
MRRLPLPFVLLLLALAAAAPAPHTKTHHHHASNKQAHVRPAPRAPKVSRAEPATPAPLPNESVSAPVAPEESRTRVTPTLFDLGEKYQGDGYPYGASPQAMDDRRSAHVPGISVKVPLR